VSPPRPSSREALARRLTRKALRVFALALLRSVYRIRVTGRERVPPPGTGALLVANHLTHVDALLVGAALAPRDVRFLMHRSFTTAPFVGRFARLFGTIPVAAEDTPEQKAESLQTAARAAAAGELVCIFAEGGISRSGALLPFARGLETIAREARVPIVPIALDRLWGSVFSFSQGRFFWKRPRRVPYPVEIAIGAPLPCDAERWQVRDAIAELVARAREARLPRMRSLAYRFLRSARRHSGAEAAVEASGRRLRYRELLREALVLRAALRRAFPDAPRIAVPASPGIESGLMHVATALLGRTAVPDAGTRVDVAALRARASSAERALAAILSWMPGALLARLLDPVEDASAPAAVFHARTTGDVVLSHGNLASNAQSLAQMFGFGPDETVLGVLPLSSVLGAVSTIWIPFLSGGRVVFAGEERVGEAGARETPTVLVGTPSLYRTWLAACRPEDLASVRLFVCGGETLAPELREAWAGRFHVELCEGYGCTELSAVVAVNLPGIESRDARQNASRPGTVGRAIPGVAVRVVDPATGATLPPETEGLLVARGPGRMLGYRDDEARTASAVRDGWFSTGDRAVIDKDAFLRITAPRAPDASAAHDARRAAR
jgi:acyl-[acyl-carrier-protein]-phospholipid O-acyltransferase/long-chain-fatty-acid--[acyl-carrier-protein] ligase